MMTRLRRIGVGIFVAVLLAIVTPRAPLKAQTQLICWDEYTNVYNKNVDPCVDNGNNTYSCQIVGSGYWTTYCYAFWTDDGGGGWDEYPTVGDGGAYPGSNVTPAPSVNILKADIQSDMLLVEVGPPNVSATGHLEVTLTGDDGLSVTLDSRDDVGPGRYQKTMQAASLPPGIYRQVAATWAPASTSASVSVSFKVLGQIRHTTYNTPEEAQCHDDVSWETFVANLNSDCSYANYPLYVMNSFFVTRANDSGSGIPFLTQYPVQKDWLCHNDDVVNIFRQVQRVTSKYNRTLSDSSVAWNASVTPDLALDDRILIVGHGIKYAVDRCG